MRTSICRLVVPFAAALLLQAGAVAAPVTYIFKGTIAGTLDGVSVQGALTLTVTGDTDDVTVQSGNQYRLEVPANVPTFDLEGSGSFVITNDSYVFDNQALGVLGFGVLGLPVACCDIIQHRVGDTYENYDLKSSFGPLDAPSNPSLGDWIDVPTSAGPFTVTRMENNSFQAIVASVPEPGALALMLLALLPLAMPGVLRRRVTMGR